MAAPLLAPSLITASASIVVVLAVFVASQFAQLLNERLQAAPVRMNSRLREPYGPLSALVAVNEQLWAAMRGTWLPRRQSDCLSEGESKRWQRWLLYGLMPPAAMQFSGQRILGYSVSNS